MSAWDPVITTSKADHYSTDEDEESSVPLQCKITVIKPRAQRRATNQPLHQTNYSLDSQMCVTLITQISEKSWRGTHPMPLFCGFNQCYHFTQTLRRASPRRQNHFWTLCTFCCCDISLSKAIRKAVKHRNHSHSHSIRSLRVRRESSAITNIRTYC